MGNRRGMPADVLLPNPRDYQHQQPSRLSGTLETISISNPWDYQHRQPSRLSAHQSHWLHFFDFSPLCAADVYLPNSLETTSISQEQYLGKAAGVPVLGLGKGDKAI